MILGIYDIMSYLFIILGNFLAVAGIIFIFTSNVINNNEKN